MIGNSVLAGIVVAHWLGVEGVGQLAVINVSVTTLVQLGSLGFPSSNTYFISKDPELFRSATLNSFAFAIVAGSILAVGLVLAAQLKPAWFGSVPHDLFRVAALSIPFQLLTLIGLNIFLAIGRIREFNLLDLLGQSFVLINVLIALVLTRSNLSTLVTLNTLAAAAVALLIAVLVFTSRRDESSRWTIDRSLFVLMFKYGIKSHIAILAGALIFRADLLVVNHFRGADEAGVYSVASQFAMMLMLLPSVIATLLFPRVTAEQDKSGATTCLVARATTLVLLLCCLAAVPFSLLIPIVYGSAFSDSSTQLLILLPGVLLVGIQSVVVQHFAASGFPKAVPAFWLVTLAFNIVLVFGLVPKFGARGAAAASTFSYCMISALIITHFCRVTGRSLSEVFLVRRTELTPIVNAGKGVLRASR